MNIDGVLGQMVYLAKRNMEVFAIVEKRTVSGWEALPKLDLYMDQVCIAVADAIGPVSAQEGALTPTMVNNYVKGKLLDAPKKKKYSTAHVSRLIIITLLKRVLSLNEIAAVLDDLFGGREDQAAYGLFGEALAAALGGADIPAACPALLGAALQALAGKLEVERILAAAIEG